MKQIANVIQQFGLFHVKICKNIAWWSVYKLATLLLLSSVSWNHHRAHLSRKLLNYTQKKCIIINILLIFDFHSSRFCVSWWLSRVHKNSRIYLISTEWKLNRINIPTLCIGLWLYVVVAIFFVCLHFNLPVYFIFH